KKAALEAEISSTRAAWSEEQEKRVLEQKEFDDNLKKQRQRERADQQQANHGSGHGLASHYQNWTFGAVSVPGAALK
ncbi:MAG: hypothetical protein AAB303_03115, partial [Chloroflexota bacterium]